MQQPWFNYRAVVPRSRREMNHSMMCLIITPIISFFITWVLSFLVFLAITFVIGYIVSVMRQPRRVSIATNFGNFGGFSTVDTGLDNSAIEALPTFEYQRENNNVGSDFGDASSECSSCTSNRWAQCAICLSVLKIGDMVKQLPVCKHFFHIECIDKWLRLHSTCPMCRSTVLADAAPAEHPV
ncbi:RING-H2 finger protein ATL32 [Rhynchospora pubera]|uniref:RING-H2 finger protein ATL32 n=1 Tax=Rhynchospora pubera TaxID=906938 RepID=A0AAV8GW25_9POAL|nr:RING-H2 finger protein ATL32 [Rhynchospora pubera]